MPSICHKESTTWEGACYFDVPMLEAWLNAKIFDAVFQNLLIWKLRQSSTPFSSSWATKSSAKIVVEINILCENICHRTDWRVTKLYLQSLLTKGILDQYFHGLLPLSFPEYNFLWKAHSASPHCVLWKVQPQVICRCLKRCFSHKVAQLTQNWLSDHLNWLWSFGLKQHCIGMFFRVRQIFVQAFLKQFWWA